MFNGYIATVHNTDGDTLATIDYTTNSWAKRSAAGRDGVWTMPMCPLAVVGMVLADLKWAEIPKDRRVAVIEPGSGKSPDIYDETRLQDELELERIAG